SGWPAHLQDRQLVLRSLPFGRTATGYPDSRVPQLLQNFPALTVWWHSGQMTSGVAADGWDSAATCNAAPHVVQKRASSWLSTPQRGQVTPWATDTSACRAPTWAP